MLAVGLIPDAHVPQPIGYARALSPHEKILNSVDRVLHTLIRARCNLISFGVRARRCTVQVTRNQLDRHFAAAFDRGRPWDYVHKINRRDTFRHQHHGELLMVRGHWNWLPIRFDADEHNGEVDGQALLLWLKAKYLPQMFIATSANGWSGYVWFQLPTWTDDEGEEHLGCSYANVNRIRRDLHANLPALVNVQNFQATIEVQGSFLERVTYRDGFDCQVAPDKVAENALGPGTMAKLPVFASIDEVRAFAAAIVNLNTNDLDGSGTDSGFRRLMLDAAAAKDAEPLPSLLEVHRNTFSEYGRGETIHVVDKSNKPATARVSLRAACRRLGIQTREAAQARTAEVLREGHHLYIENGFGDSKRDRKRVNRFVSTWRWMLSTWSDGSQGGSTQPVWFDDSYIAETEHKIRSLAAAMRMIDRYNATPGKRKHGLLTPRIVAVALLTWAKNLTINKDGEQSQGFCPAKAIKGMLKHFGLVTGGSIVAGCRRLLIALEFIRETGRPCHWEEPDGFKAGQCARYAFNSQKLHWLPWSNTNGFTTVTFEPVHKNADAQDEVRGSQHPSVFFSHSYRGADTQAAASRTVVRRVVQAFSTICEAVLGQVTINLCQNPEPPL